MMHGVNMLQVSQRMIDGLKEFEACSLAVYEDEGKQAIGWGHDLLPGESFPNGITQEEADQLLASDLPKYEDQVNSLGLTLTQGQFDALVDFCYNEGFGHLQTMLAHGIDQVPVQLPRWDYAGGKVNQNLQTRREWEVSLWNGE
jgi:lysozyme